MRNIYRKTTRLALLFSMSVLALFSQNALAHGGLALDKDVCKLKIGEYFMHFAGYQPDAAGIKEFCEDIPNTGRTVVVLDDVNDELRSIPIEVRVIRDTGNETDLDAVTVLHLPRQLHPTGSISFEYNFTTPGKYIGLVNAGDKGQHVSRFPFSVGIVSNKSLIAEYLPILGVLLGGVALYFYSGYRRGKNKNTSQ